MLLKLCLFTIFCSSIRNVDSKNTNITSAQRSEYNRIRGILSTRATLELGDPCSVEVEKLRAELKGLILSNRDSERQINVNNQIYLLGKPSCNGGKNLICDAILQKCVCGYILPETTRGWKLVADNGVCRLDEGSWCEPYYVGDCKSNTKCLEHPKYFSHTCQSNR